MRGSPLTGWKLVHDYPATPQLRGPSCEHHYVLSTPVSGDTATAAPVPLKSFPWLLQPPPLLTDPEQTHVGFPLSLEGTPCLPSAGAAPWDTKPEKRSGAICQAGPASRGCPHNLCPQPRHRLQRARATAAHTNKIGQNHSQASTPGGAKGTCSGRGAHPPPQASSASGAGGQLPRAPCEALEELSEVPVSPCLRQATLCPGPAGLASLQSSHC